MTIANPYGCVQCKYFCNQKASLKKHLTSNKHKLNSVVTEKDENCKHQCKVCNKKYLSQPGLWAHNKKCKPVVGVEAPEPIIPAVVEVAIETDLHAKIDNLERIMREMAKNLVS